MELKNLQLYRENFTSYLKSTPGFRRADDSVIESQINYTEQELYSFLLSECALQQDNVYLYVDKEELNTILALLLPNNRLGDKNRQSDGKLRPALRLYIGFLDSKYHPLSEKQKPNKRKKAQKGAAVNPNTSTPPTAPETTMLPASADKTDDKKPAEKKPVIEGAVLQNRDCEVHQRNPKARLQCIAAYGNEYRCIVCGMNFVEAYGEIGKDYIEVHHLYPIAETDGAHEINGATDMIPLCSNCHSMIHRQEDVSDWKGLKDRIQQKKQ